MAFDYIRIAFFDKCGESPERVSLGFFYVVRIDNDQFFPAGVVRERDAHHVIVVAGVIPTRRATESTSSCMRFSSSKGNSLNKRAASRGEIMLNRIGKREKIAAGVLESVAKRNQFLPAIDCDQPAVLQIAPEFLRLDAKIDNV